MQIFMGNGWLTVEWIISILMDLKVVFIKGMGNILLSVSSVSFSIVIRKMEVNIYA
ncbi:hypothetical protein D3C72_2457240 [compost metagenome]